MDPFKLAVCSPAWLQRRLRSWVRAKLSKFALESRGAHSQNDLSAFDGLIAGLCQGSETCLECRGADRHRRTVECAERHHGLKKVAVFDGETLMHNPGLEKRGIHWWNAKDFVFKTCLNSEVITSKCGLLCYCAALGMLQQQRVSPVWWWESRQRSRWSVLGNPGIGRRQNNGGVFFWCPCRSVWW